MAKTNRFRVKEFEDERITVEEERKDRSPFIWFLIKNWKLIFIMSLLFSVLIFVGGVYLAMRNTKESSIVEYESNGVKVSFDGKDSSVLNGTPITSEYASKLFNSNVNSHTDGVGVVLKLKEVQLDDRTITFYSDKSALVEYEDGTYLWVSGVNGDYGISEDGVINAKAKTKDLTGEVTYNEELGITILEFSDGSMEVTKDDTTFYVRNSDITNNSDEFYTNLSGVSVPTSKDNDRTIYSDGTIKEGDHIIVDGNSYGIKEEKTVCGGIKITYYENGYAEVTYEDNSVMVEKSEHIVYDDNILEIVDNSNNNDNDPQVKDLMDFKDITLENTNATKAHYLIVLEETNDYAKHNVNKRLANEFINFNVYANGKTTNNNVLNNNLKGSSVLEGVSLENNTYLLDEGTIEKLSSTNVKIGLWINYEDITNDYMNAAFIGTVKVYIESLD